MSAAITILREQRPSCWRNGRDEFVTPMCAGTINLPQHFIVEWTEFVLKNYAVYGQHRGVSEAVALTRTIHCIALMLR